MSHTLDDFINLLQTAMQNGEFRSMTLADLFKKKNSKSPHKQTVRPILIKDQVVYQWELPTAKKQKHLNLSAEETLKRFQNKFGAIYREAYLFTSTVDVSARAAKKGIHIKSKPATDKSEVAPQPHNREKVYLIPEGKPCGFLKALGVMNAEGVVKKQKLKKFRQINRYLEIVNDTYSQLPASGPIKVVDFGCGLSYLTFALHHLLTVIHQRKVIMVGIDRDEAVIARCAEISKSLGLEGLKFHTGEIEKNSGERTVDLAISLHACDTATDHALAYAVSANANVILAVPCCQHELFTSIDCLPLKPVTQFGILKERFAAQATDALRALALNQRSYQTQILEFIDLEHTPKNLLIRAVKQPGKVINSDEYQSFKSYLGVTKLATDIILDVNVTEKPDFVEEPESAEEQPVEDVALIPPTDSAPEVVDAAAEATFSQPSEVTPFEPEIVKPEPVVEAQVEQQAVVEQTTEPPVTECETADDSGSDNGAVESNVDATSDAQQGGQSEKDTRESAPSPWGNRK